MNSISLKPKLSELYELNEFISSIISQEDLHINLIVEEIFVNIVNYSNAEFIKVDACFEDSVLTLEFADNGFEFNPLMREKPKSPETIEDAQIGGLGIYLAREMADELDYHYCNGENHLKIIKKVE